MEKLSRYAKIDRDKDIMIVKGGKHLVDPKEVIIKSKKCVQKHGEVFTPKHIVKMMLDQPGIKEACESLTATFLEMIIPLTIQFNRVKSLDVAVLLESKGAISGVF